MFCTFPSKSSALHLLNLFLHIFSLMPTNVCGIVFISFPYCSLQVYGNTIYFCILVSYPAVLLVCFFNYWIPWYFLYTKACHLEIGIVHLKYLLQIEIVFAFSLSLLDSFYFIFLSPFPSYYNIGQRWGEWVSLPWFLILESIQSLTIKYNWIFHIWPLSD